MQLVEEQMIRAQSMTVAFQLMKLTVLMLILSHWAACIWHAVPLLYTGDEGSWIEDQRLEGTPVFRRYVAAFYYAITTGTTVGYGDIHPVNGLEQVAAIVLLVGSVAYIGQFLARVSQMVGSLKKAETEMVQAKRDALLFMAKRGVQRELQLKVTRYIEHVFETDAVTSLDSKVLGLLSESLQMQLALAVTGSVLKQFPLFGDADDGFVSGLCRICRTQRFWVGDTVVSEERAATEMYWIVRGEVQILQKGKRIGGLRSGDWFGELALFFPGAIRTATIRCETNCEFLVLHHDDFVTQMSIFPKLKKDYEKLAQELRKGNFKSLRVECSNCGQEGHYARDCPNDASD